jgi:hypothetical protein
MWKVPSQWSASRIAGSAVVLLVVALAMTGCSGTSKSKSADTSGAKQEGSQGCLVPEGGVKLCGEDAVDWCANNPGVKPKYGDCSQILGPNPAKPPKAPEDVTPPESSVPGVTPGNGGAAAPDSGAQPQVVQAPQVPVGPDVPVGPEVPEVPQGAPPVGSTPDGGTPPPDTMCAHGCTPGGPSFDPNGGSGDQTGAG